MKLTDSAAEAEFRHNLRRWLSQQLPPTDEPVRRWSRPQLRQWSRQLHQAGYAGLTWPSQFGGRGLAPTYQAIFAEETAAAEAPDHLNTIGINMVGPTLIAHGSPEQQQRYLPGILSGDNLFCQGFSEPGAGSDLSSVRTSAVARGDGYTLTGEKVWSSYADLADHCLLLARTDPQAPKHEGLTCFIVDMHQPGVAVRPIRQLSGDSDFHQIVLTGARVRATDIVGALHGGWSVALSTLAHERGTFGIALTARLSIQFARVVRAIGQAGLAGDPVLRRELADLFTRLQGLRYTGYRALAAQQRSGQPGPESSILKLEWSQVHQELCTLALQIQGTAALLDQDDADWGGYWQQQRLRSRANSIEGGTSEILRGIIAERVLGLPRSRR